MSIKVPVCMHAAMDRWFAISEAQFKLGNTKNENSISFHVLLLLPPEVISTLMSTIVASKEYAELKDAVMTGYQRTRPEVFEKVMVWAQMMGASMSLCQLPAKSVWETILFVITLSRRYPMEITPVIVAVKNASLLELDIWPFLRPRKVQNTTTPNRNRYTRPTTFTGTMPRTTYNTRPFHENQKPLVCRRYLYSVERSRICKR